MNEWEYLRGSVDGLRAHAEKVRADVERLYHAKLFREESNMALVEGLNDCRERITGAMSFLPSMSQADLDAHHRMMGAYYARRGELRGLMTGGGGRCEAALVRLDPIVLTGEDDGTPDES